MKRKDSYKIMAVIIIFLLSGGCFYWQTHNVKAESKAIWGIADAREININSKVSGRVVKINVREGDYVQAGDVLAVLDKDTTANDVAQAQAGVQSQYYQLQQSILLSKMENENSAAAVKAAQAQADSARAAMELAARDAERYKILLAQSAVAQQVYDSYQAKYTMAAASCNEAQAAVENARAGLVKNAANQENEKMQQEQLNLLKSKLDNAEILEDETIIRAPFSGVITKKYIEDGNLVSPTVPLFSLQDSNDNWVDFKISETDIDKYSLNEQIEITGRNDKLKVNGIIVHISRKPDFATVKATSERGDKDVVTFNVKVQTNADNIWPGMQFKMSGKR